MPGDMPGMEQDGFMAKVKDIASKWYTWVTLVALAFVGFMIARKIHHKKRDKELTLDE